MRIREMNEAVQRELRQLEQWFEGRGLSLEGICEPICDDQYHRLGQLSRMKAFVEEYEKTPGRVAMQRRGFAYPPVEPDHDPWSDWERFERWLRHEPLDWSYLEVFGAPPAEEELDEEQLDRELERMLENLASRNVVVSLVDDVPKELVYRYLLEEVEGRFEILDESAMLVIDGCSGYCPTCFQQRWCDMAEVLFEPERTSDSAAEVMS
jgi:hypothetical protein